MFGWVGGADDPVGAALNKRYERELLEWDLDVDGSEIGFSKGMSKQVCH